MTLEHLVANYGSFGLFVGRAWGEASAMLGGILSHQHLIEFWPAIIALALGLSGGSSVLPARARVAQWRYRSFGAG